jgi:hypothetical protein
MFTISAFFFFSFHSISPGHETKRHATEQTEKKNYAGSDNHSPHWLRKSKPLWYWVPYNSFTGRQKRPSQWGSATEYQKEERSHKETGVPVSYKQEHQAQTLQS